MSFFGDVIAHLRAENERLRPALESYEAGRSDIGDVSASGEITSMRNDMITHYKRTIESNQLIIDSYERGER